MSINSIDLSIKPDVKAFFDPNTNTISYVVSDPTTKACSVVDSVLDIDYASGQITYNHADEIIEYISSNHLRLEWIIETHVHADHLSAAPYLQDKLGGKIGISKKIIEVQETWGIIFNEGTDFQRDGSQFDVLFEDGDVYKIGSLKAFVIATPGHTPACMVHVIGNSAFIGDTLFMPDGGSARADFPGGNADDLFTSIQKVLSLPDTLRLFMCHDYGPNGRDIRWETTVGDEKAHNIHVGYGTSREKFIKLRTERDASLTMPKLIIPALQVNIRAGEIPSDEAGRPSLKVPINKL